MVSNPVNFNNHVYVVDLEPNSTSIFISWHSGPESGTRHAEGHWIQRETGHISVRLGGTSNSR
jgi:hypothetical protein